MAWRIHESVVRGELDNRQRNVVRGRLWLHGLAKPVMIELTGNACADLAGCFLQFTNPEPTLPLRTDAEFAPRQRGRIGDLTASRKVRVYDVPLAEAQAMLDRGEKPPEHLANSLYLEWFSEANGRVVIEGAGWDITISPPEWRLAPADEQQRRADAAAGWRSFVDQLDQAVAKHQHGAADPEADWDEHDHERFLRESDARTDKYMELLEKYGHSPEAHEQIAKEMGWDRELTPEEAAEEERRIDEMNAACEEALNEPPPEPDPAREGIDWIRTADGEIKHPLEHRCQESALKFWHQCEALGLSREEDHDVGRFLFEFHMTAAKLAGALGSIADGVAVPEPGFTIAYLKRALGHLHQSQAGLEAAAARPRPPAGPEPLLPATLVAAARQELFAIREEILRLMQELRNQR